MKNRMSREAHVMLFEDLEVRPPELLNWPLPKISLTKYMTILILLRQTNTAGGRTMTKADLIEKIAAGTKLSKSNAARALDVTIGAIKGSLKKGQKVTLVGFGTFSVSKRKARTGRNPRTGEAMKISAMKVPKFIAARGLKDAVR